MLTFTNENDFDALAQSAIIDLRSKTKFFEQHIKYSCNIEISSLETRLHELPESRTIVSIVGEEKQLQIADELLTSKGYKILFRIEASSFIKFFNDFDWFESGNISSRLWKPSSVVNIFNEKFGRLINPIINSKMNSALTPLKGIDLACGAGRDSVFMAASGWEMTAVDHLASALTRVKCLAENNSCEVKMIEFDLEKIGLEKNKSALPEEWLGHYDLVIVSRYLHRPLLNDLDALLKPGGFVVYQTFLQGCEKFGSPKNPRYLLKHGELASIFASYKIHYDQVENLSDGRPTNAFIAQKQK